MGLEYTAPPTLARFMKSEAFGRLAMGPVGSGKSTACIMEMLRRSVMQMPGDDGLRHTRWAIVRQTLQQMKTTLLKDIQLWLGSLADWRVSESTIYLNFNDVRSEWILIPLDEPEDQRRLLSSQLTGAWVNEAIEVSLDLMAPLSGRCGRFPSAAFGQPTWSGIIADTNFPTEGSEWHKFCEYPPPSWEVFKQPGGRSPEVENLNWINQTASTINLPIDHPARLQRGMEFYKRNAENVNKDWVRRYVDAEYGQDPSGSAVYKESFKHSFHIQKDVEPIPTKLILVGQDFGRNPWSIITQLDHKGRLLVLEEVEGSVGGDTTGLEQHIRENLRPALSSPRYANHPIALVGDPSGMNRSSLYETNEFDLCKSLGFSAFPAPTNDLDPRLRAVEKFLTAQSGGGPALIIDQDRCPKLIEGFDGNYKFVRTKTGISKPKPDKNPWSHVQDALQYAALVAASPGAYSMVYGRIMNAANHRRAEQRRPSVKAWT